MRICARKGRKTVPSAFGGVLYMRRWTAGLAAVLLAAALVSCAPEEKRYQAQFLTLFDTVTTIVGYSGSREAFTQQAQFIHDALEEYHQLYDIYHTYEGFANLKTLNDHAGAGPVRVDRRVIDLLLTAREMNEKTGGKVNVAFGSVLSIWNDYRKRGVEDPEHAELPPMDLLRAAAAHTDIAQMVIDEENGTVSLQDPQMRLDVGAIAKGYAVQRVCAAAREKGMNALLVSVGGNVCAIGGMKGKGKKPFKVGVQDPWGEGAQDQLMTVGLADRALVTSGGYQRRYTVDGTQYHHIIDPLTLMPARYLTAVAVLCADSGTADALSTALCNMPWEDGRALIDGMPDTEALWILPDGSLKFSRSFQKYVLKTNACGPRREPDEAA